MNKILYLWGLKIASIPPSIHGPVCINQYFSVLPPVSHTELSNESCLCGDASRMPWVTMAGWFVASLMAGLMPLSPAVSLSPVINQHWRGVYIDEGNKRREMKSERRKHSRKCPSAAPSERPGVNSGLIAWIYGELIAPFSYLRYCLASVPTITAIYVRWCLPT